MMGDTTKRPTLAEELDELAVDARRLRERINAVLARGQTQPTEGSLRGADMTVGLAEDTLNRAAHHVRAMRAQMTRTTR
jgi:hypothetical protein